MEIDGQDKAPLDDITTFVNITRRRLTDYTEHVPHKLNIILVGRSGNGKSSVGNTIMGQECFPQGSNGRQHTVHLEKLHIGKFEINIMDTPNILNERQGMSTEPKLMEIIKSAMDFPNGIHLFLIVCRSDIRCGDEDKILFELEKMYGQSVFDRSLLVLTRVKEFLQGNTLEEGLKAKRDLWNVCKRVHGRVIATENDSEQLRDVTMDDQQTQLLRTVLELARLQQGTTYTSNLSNEVRKYIEDKEKKQTGIKKTYNIIFNHIVKTICDKNENDICDILKTGEFVINADVLKSNDVCKDQNIIRQCKKWCMKDLETFINLILTAKRFQQYSNDDITSDSYYDSIEMYKRRSLQTSQQIKRNREHLILIFSTDVERSIRSFLRSKELFEIDAILKKVEKNIIVSDLHQVIIQSLPDCFKSEEWKADVQYLGLQSLRQYQDIKTGVWPVAAQLLEKRGMGQPNFNAWASMLHY